MRTRISTNKDVTMADIKADEPQDTSIDKSFDKTFDVSGSDDISGNDEVRPTLSIMRGRVERKEDLESRICVSKSKKKKILTWEALSRRRISHS